MPIFGRMKRQNQMIIYRILLACLCYVLSFYHIQAQEQDLWSLKNCIEYAADNNLQVQRSALNIKRAELELDQSKRNRLPNLFGSANTSLNIGYVNDPFTNQFSNTTIRSANFSLSSQVPIYNGLRLRNAIRQNEIGLKASEFDWEQSQNDILLAVVQDYLNILFQQELAKSAELQLKTTRKRQEQVSKQVKAGTLAQAALADIAAQVATDELNLVNTRTQLELRYMQLQQRLRLDPNPNFEIETPELAEPAGPERLSEPDDIYRIALGTQPNIRASELRINQAEYGVELAKAGRRPSLALQASTFTGYSSARLRRTEEVTQRADSFEIEVLGQREYLKFFQEVPLTERIPFFPQLREQINYSFGLGLSVPIYSRGQNLTNIQQAHIAVKQARLDAELQRQSLKQTIQQSYFNVQSAYASWQATRKQMDALTTAFENAEKQLNLGTINSLDYLVAKNNLDRARNDLIRSKYEYIFRTKILDFYQGRPIVLE